MTRFLASATRHALLSDLASNGYEWKDENGIPRIPEPLEQTTNHRGHAAIYLGHVPIGVDEEGITIFSEDFCANTTEDPEGVFATEIPKPANPYNEFQ
jgi:hypothetical protein